ncbi:hypothetical protein ACE6H2_001929 [Prunus campanulata]
MALFMRQLAPRHHSKMIRKCEPTTLISSNDKYVNFEDKFFIRGGMVKCFKCVGTSLPSMRPFGSSLLTGFGVIGTPKLSELGARAIPGWVTHWEVSRELPKTKP